MAVRGELGTQADEVIGLPVEDEGNAFALHRLDAPHQVQDGEAPVGQRRHAVRGEARRVWPTVDERRAHRLHRVPAGGGVETHFAGDATHGEKRCSRQEEP